MRKALFAIVLVAASFGGGMVVNGPGLRWAQSQLLSRMGYDDDGDAVATSSPGTDDATTPGAFPARPIPPLVIERPATPAGNTSKPTPAPASTTKIDETPGALPGLPPVPETPVQPHDAATSTADVTPASPPPALETSRDRERAAVELAAATAAATQESPPARDTTLRSASLAASTPAAVAAPASVPAAAVTETPNPNLIPGDPADWPAVRKALRDLGVARYGIEGETNGKVRFHCIIPLAGRRAVGQHFEADGDDEFQAARALLRRVALWRATETSGR